MPYKLIKRKLGMSLIEVLVVIALIGLITGVLGDLFITTWRTYHYTNEALTQEQESRMAMEKIARDLRAVSSFEFIETNSISFFRYYGNDVAPTRIQVWGLGNVLQYKKTPPSGTYPNITYLAEDDQVSDLSTHLTNGEEPVFVKYDTNNQINNDLSVGQVKMVGVNIVIDINPNRSPSAFHLNSTIQLRNMKTN